MFPFCPARYFAGMWKRCLCLCSPFLATFIQAQDPSLIPRDLSMLRSATSDTARMRLHNRIAFNYADKDPAQGVEHGMRSLEIAQRVQDPQAMGVTRNTIGYCHTRLSAFAKADSMYRLALVDLEKADDKCSLSMCWYNMGLNAQMQGLLPTTLQHFLRAVEVGNHCPDQSQHSIRLYGLGSVYESMGRFHEALRYYSEAFTIDSARHDSARLAKEHIALANTLGNIDRMDEVMDHYRASIQCSEAVGDTMMTGYVWYNCASVMYARGKVSEAVEYAERAVGVFVVLDRPAELVHTENYLGWLYNMAERPADAERVLRHTLPIATKLGLKEERMNALQYLATAQRKQGNAEAALENFEAYMALKDSIAGEQQKKELAEITGKYETEKKEKALLESKGLEAASREEAQRQRTMKFVYLACALLLGSFALVFVGRYRMKRKVADALAITNAEMLRQKERAEESERAKDRFLANMSHEIRTPLNAIIGFTDLMLHEQHDERTAHYLSSVRDAGDNLLVLINDVLDLSRLEAGRLTLASTPFDLHRCVRACEELLAERAREQRDTLSVNIADGVPQWVTGDGARLHQILLNLLGNALKFTMDGTVRLSVEQHGDQVRFRIRDTGIGIPKEKLANVFERFTQVHTDDHDRYGGTGLGLSIVKELVAMHHGHIEVESEPGRGTTFTMELPYRPSGHIAERKVAPNEHPPSGSALNGRTILVAEDNPVNARVTNDMLKRHYPLVNVITVQNGREAVDRIIADTNGSIALVLMDVQMPVLDGIAATREVRALANANATMPIIALTASVLPSDLTKCIAAGMDAFVLKPFKAHELVDAITRLVGDTARALVAAEDDDGTEQKALFQELVPQRLELLRKAHAARDHAETQRLVHFMRFQLARYDPDRFAELIERLLNADAGTTFDKDMDLLIAHIEAELV